MLTIFRQLQTAAQQPFLLACQALVQHQVWDVLVAKTGVRPPTLELRKGWVVLDDLVIGVVPHGKEFRILDLLKLGDLTGRDERRCVGRTWVCLRRNQSREDERESEWHSASQGGERVCPLPRLSAPKAANSQRDQVCLISMTTEVDQTDMDLFKDVSRAHNVVLI